jgi:uncharacterized protein
VTRAGSTAAPAEVRETHIGVVLLAGDRAVKMKKPVRTDFLDFTTPALRRAACHREVQLNRRLAPDVYLGVSDVLAPDGTDAVEHLVVMRRMPADRCLATLVTSGAAVTDHLRALARLMAAFHARADRSVAIAADGSREALRRRWAANVEELAPYAGTVLDAALVDALGRLATRFLDGRGPLLHGRGDRIIDGHGDLIAADVFCLDDGPRVLDCLEFDDHLRHVDALDDVAFLAMDLERLGRPDLADAFLADYAEFSGDPAPAALRHHYIAYRAVVRAKVACLRHHQGDPAAAADATRYASLALLHLERGAVRLALVGGLPGTGKTTVGGALADRFGAVLLSSDRVRKELAGIDADRPATAAFGAGIYTPERTATTYAELLRRACGLLARGESVVLDASWTSRRLREDAEDLARRTGSDLLALCCETAPAAAARRLTTRPRTASDATPAIAVAVAEHADPWPGATVVPTSGTVADALGVAARAWQGAVHMSMSTKNGAP